MVLVHLQEPLSITEIERRVDMPEGTLARLFKRYLNTTPAAYYRYLRLSQAKNLLQNSKYRINEIGNLCGFENPESFSRAYKRAFGVAASQDRGEAVWKEFRLKGERSSCSHLKERTQAANGFLDAEFCPQRVN